MRRSRGWLVRFILVICLCAIGAGCGMKQSAEVDAVQPIKLSIMHNWTVEDGKSAAMRGVLDAFKETHPHIVIEEEGLSTEGLKSRLRTLAAADEMPDLFVMWPDAMTKQFVKADLIQPIDEFLNSHPDWRDSFMAHAFDDYTVDGRIYTVPMNLAPTSLIYYNEALFEQYKVPVPTTWAELIAAVEAFNRADIIPIALGNKNTWVVQSTILSTLADRVTGTEWFLRAAAGEGASFTDPVFIEALVLLKQLAEVNAFQEGFSHIDENQMMNLYYEGKAAMVINGGWALSGIVRNAPAEVLDHTRITILPSIEGGKGNPRSTSGAVGTGLGVNKNLTGERKEAALELLYALSGPDGQRATLNGSTLISYQLEGGVADAHPLFIELKELIDHVKISPVYDTKLGALSAEAINNGLQELLQGKAPQLVAEQIQQAHAQSAGR